MTLDSPQPNPVLTPDQWLLIDRACEQFEAALDTPDHRTIEEVLHQLPSIEAVQQRGLEELLALEWEHRSKNEQPIEITEYQERFPDQASLVVQAWSKRQSNEPSQASLQVPTVLFDGRSQAGHLDRWIDRFRKKSQSESIERIGDFRIIREIGRGGMGIVFEAQQLSLDRSVALKVLWFGAVSDVDAIKRFQREASTVAKLHHTNIVPIFSVGSDGSINYYAMQLIDGSSLDRVAKNTLGPVDWSKVAEWGLQAAEALEHAHLRGVIHRDVKPSNLILDREDRIWLTDFGLAKRSDDVTLSMAGAVLGTPRYMSPEQASSSTRSVDHRSDIYSLGATLYEIVTGKPVFDAATPHGVISQILTAQPIPASQISRNLPRDFNTILMKCLAKNAADRYESAQDLAKDLRALIDGRPIQAKRQNWLGMARQFVKSHRREFGWSVTSVVTVGLGMLVAIGSWYAWHKLREVQLGLSSTDSPIVAQLIQADGSPAIRPQTVPTQDPLPVQPGSYSMRVTAPNLLSQDYRVDLSPGEVRKQPLQPSDQTIGPNISNRFEASLIHSQQGARMISYDESHLEIDDRTLQVRKTARIAWSDFNKPADSNATVTTCGFVWPPSPGSSSQLDIADKYDIRPWFFDEAIDWNGDGVEDYLMATRHQAMVALFDSKGRIWSTGLAPDVTETPISGDGSYAMNFYCQRSTVVEKPVSIGDIDQDGCPDLAVQVASINPTGTPDVSTATCRIQALSGKTGNVLWSFTIPEKWRSPDQGETPYWYRWFTGTSSGHSAGGSGYFMHGDHWVRQSSNQHERTGSHVPCAAIISAGSMDNSMIVQAADHLWFLNPSTGQPQQDMQSMGMVPYRPPVLAEIPGRPGTILYFLEDLEGQVNSHTSPPSTYQSQIRVVAWSISENRSLWNRVIDAHLPFQQSWFYDQPAWPVTVDLDDDGRCEILVPDASTINQTAPKESTQLTALSSTDGHILWKADIRHADSQVNQFLAGDDVDGDGTRDVFAATISGMPIRLHVDCLSGHDGHRIWTSHVDIANRIAPQSYHPHRIFRWNSTEDGLDQIVVSLISQNDSDDSRPETYFFSARTGRILHQLLDSERLEVGDINGDGTEDLAITRYLNSRLGMSGRCEKILVHGSAGDLWNRLGNPVQVVQDLDGDGSQDLIESNSTGLIAISSITGDKLWNHRKAGYIPKFRILSPIEASNRNGLRLDGKELAHWDLDRDGVLDFIVENEPGGYAVETLEAISGRTGDRLWRAKNKRRYCQGSAKIRCVDLDGDGQAEVLNYVFDDSVFEESGIRHSWSSQDGHLHLRVYSGSDGSLLWMTPLSRQYGSNGLQPQRLTSQGDYPEPTLVDMNGDGCQDIVVAAEPRESSSTPRAADLVALDGRTGKELWRRPGAVVQSSNDLLKAASRVALGRGMAPNASVLYLVDDPYDAPSQGPTRSIRLTCLNPTTNVDQWTRSIEVDDHVGRNLGPEEIGLSPRALRRSDGRDWVLVGYSYQQQQGLEIFDDHGNSICKRAFPESQPYAYRLPMITIGDCDGDRNDDVVILQNGIDVYRVGPELEKIYHLSDYVDVWGSTQVQLWPSPEQPFVQLVLTYDQQQPCAKGFDARTGNALWQAFGPTKHRDYSTEYQPIQLLRNQQLGLPLVVFNHLNQSHCRIPQPIETSTANATPRLHLISRAHDRAHLPESEDSRRLRKLPWVESFEGARNSIELPIVLTSGVLNSLALVIVPGWYLIRTISRRRFDLRWWLLLPPIVAFGMLALLNRVAEIPVSIYEKIGLAFYFAPPVLLIVTIVYHGFTGRWRSILWKAAWIVLTSLILGTGMIAFAFSKQTIDSDQQYATTGWYWIFMLGFMVYSWIDPVAFVLQRALLSRKSKTANAN